MLAGNGLRSATAMNFLARRFVNNATNQLVTYVRPSHVSGNYIDVKVNGDVHKGVPQNDNNCQIRNAIKPAGGIEDNNQTKRYVSFADSLTSLKINGVPSVASFYRDSSPGLFMGLRMVQPMGCRNMTTVGASDEPALQDTSASATELHPRIKFKRLDKTARHIMQILDKEAVEEVKSQREIPDIRPGYIIQLRLEAPENKRRVSTVKGIVIARRNAGLNTTIRIRRMVAGVGVESLLPLYSPNIKEITVLDKKRVRRAKLYYLRDKMNALNK